MPLNEDIVTPNSKEIAGKEVLDISLETDTYNKLQEYQKQFEPFARKFLIYTKNPTEKIFYLSPDTYSAILKLVPYYFNALRPYFEDSDNLEEWEIRNISAILGKALIPDSIAPTLANAKKIARDI